MIFNNTLTALVHQIRCLPFFSFFLSFSAALILFYFMHITNHSLLQLMTPRHDSPSLDYTSGNLLLPQIAFKFQMSSSFSFFLFHSSYIAFT